MTDISGASAACHLHGTVLADKEGASMLGREKCLFRERILESY